MDFEGVIYQKQEPFRGTSPRGEWVRQNVIFESIGEYPRKVCIEFWNERVQELTSYKEGDRLTVAINLESREFNGKWYTSARAWRIQRPQAEAQQPVPSAQPTTYSANPMANSPAAYVGDVAPMDAVAGNSGATAGALRDDIDDLPF